MRQTCKAGGLRDSFNGTPAIKERETKKPQYRLKADSIQLSMPKEPEKMMLGFGSTTSQKSNKSSIRSHKNSFNGPASSTHKYP